MQARMKNPVMFYPDALQAMFAIQAAVDRGGQPATTRKLIHLRVSQINGCSVCVDMHARELKQEGESDERLFAVAAWVLLREETGAEGAVRLLVLAERFSYNRWIPSMAWAPVAERAEERVPGRIDAVRAELADVAGAALRRAALAALTAPSG